MTVSLKNARLRIPNAFRFLLALGWGILGFVPAVLAVVASIPLWASILVPLFYMTGIYGLARAWLGNWRSLRGHVRADENGLFLDGKRVVARKRLLHGYVHIDGATQFLRLARRSLLTPRPIDIEITDESQANELLAAMRLDAKTSVGEYAMLHGHRRTALVKESAVVGVMLALLTGFFLGLLHPSTPFQVTITTGIGFAVSTLSVLLYGISQAIRLSVGADGILLWRWPGSRRFISFADIREVTAEGRDFTIILRDDTKLAVHQGSDFAENERDNSALVGRIRAALAAYRETPAAPRISGIDVTSDKRASYRTTALPEDQLWRIVEDPSAPASERTAAAGALRLELDDSGRQRLRVAAGASASKELRVALEELAEDDDVTPGKRARLSR
jgi:hypothetical protein